MHGRARLFAAAVSAWLPLCAGAADYQVIDLGTLPGNTVSQAFRINDAGAIAGIAAPTTGTGFNSRRAVVWAPGTHAITDLGIGTGYSEAWGVTPSGTVVGLYQTGPAFANGEIPTAAVSWNGTTPTAIGPVGAVTSSAFSINAAGTAVGQYRTVAPPSSLFGFRNDGGAAAQLVSPDPNRQILYGTAVNDAGQVSGGLVNLQPADPFAHVYVLGPGGALQVYASPPDGGATLARDLNNLGAVAGYGNFPNQTANPNLNDRSTRVEHAMLFTAGGATVDIGLLPGFGHEHSIAWGINDAGAVVGGSYLTSSTGALVDARAFIYQAGMLRNLNDLIDPASGWSLRFARDINNNGEIVGWGVVGGAVHAFLLTPVPEPSTYAMLTAGLLLFVGVRRVRARSAYRSAVR